MSGSKKDYSILFCRFPGGSAEHPDSSDWVFSQIEKIQANKEKYRVSKWGRAKYSNTPITMTRNLAVKNALAGGWDYLLMIDSDMSPDIGGSDSVPFFDSSWRFLLALRDIEDEMRSKGAPTDQMPRPATVAAPYCGPAPDELVYVFQWKTTESGCKNPSFSLEMIERESTIYRSGIQEVAALPTGLILYDMRVFKELPPPWFEYEWTDETRSVKATTEDVYQTRNASLLRMPQFCNWDAWSWHIKSKYVGKPVLMTIDSVHRSLADAINLGLKRGDRYVFVDDAAYEQAKSMAKCDG